MIKEFNFEENKIFVDIREIKTNTFFFISSDGYTNPSQFTFEIFNFIKSNYNLKKSYIYLDLSKLFGKKNTNWFYKVDYEITKDNDYLDEKCIPANKLNIKTKIESNAIKEYLEKYSNVDEKYLIS